MIIDWATENADAMIPKTFRNYYQLIVLLMRTTIDYISQIVVDAIEDERIDILFVQW